MILRKKDNEENLAEVIDELKKIINDMQDSTELKEIERENLCNIILDYIQNRTNILKDFFDKSYVLRWNSQSDEILQFRSSLEKLKTDDESEEIKNISNKIAISYMEDVRFYINKFLKEQYSKLQMLLEDINCTDRELHQRKSTIYHNEVRDLLSCFVEIYNKTLNSIQQRKICIDRKSILNVYDDSDEIITYKDNKDKNSKLKNIIDYLKCVDYRKISIFIDEFDKENGTFKDIDVENMLCIILNGYMIEENDIYTMLRWNNEVFDENKAGSFAAQIRMSHVIFLNVISDTLRHRLEELKTRCNMKFYYFINKNNY